MHEKNVQDQKETKENFFTKHKTIIFIILILILAFSIRGHLLKYDYMFEFDTYWHLRMTGYYMQGNLPEFDLLGFYAQGGTPNHWPPFVWIFTSAIYFIFTLGGSFNKELLMVFARILPAVFGALISVAMYFLGKEIYNKRAGLVMGVISATIPAFVYRTMAGFYEEDALGFLWLIIGFIFLVKAIKNIENTKQYIINALISAAFFGLMAYTWDAFLLVPIILIGFFVTNLAYMFYKKTSKVLIKKFTYIFLITFVVFSIIASVVHPTWINTTLNYAKDHLPFGKTHTNKFANNDLDDSNVVAASVGEEQKGNSFFLYKYSFSIWIPFVVLLLIPIYLLFFKRNDYLTLLLFVWIFVSLYLAWSKLKFTFYLGLPIAAAAGFLFFFIEYIFSLKQSSLKNPLLFKRIFVLFFGLIVLSSIAAGTHEVYTKVPQIVENTDWRESIFWLAENTSEDAKIFNWWDYGHWITYFTERKASSDNTNAFQEANKDFSLFILTEDINFTKEIMLKYDTDYFIADNDFFNKYTAFGSYGYSTTNYQDPRIAKNLSIAIDCYKATSLDNSIFYKCADNILLEDDMHTIPTTWTTTPLDIVNGMPIYIYRLEDNSKLFYFNSSANNTALVKIWFSETNYSKIFDLAYKNGGVRVYKINKTALIE